MCLLLISYRQHPHYPLLILANRDEFYQRPTAAAAPWNTRKIIAGRDLQAGGTWLGIAPGGRVAAVTNIREPGITEPPQVLSRGKIPVGFLSATQTPVSFAADLPGQRYRGFNALLFDPHAVQSLVCAGNRHLPFPMKPGIHGISNGPPDAPWPKVTRGGEVLRKLVAAIPDRVDTENFVVPGLKLLTDPERAARSQLPDTGVGEAMESALSSIFVRIEGDDLREDSPATMRSGYGTRASTLVAVADDGGVQMWEQSFVDGQTQGKTRHLDFPPP